MFLEDGGEVLRDHIDHLVVRDRYDATVVILLRHPVIDLFDVGVALLDTVIPFEA